MPPDVANVAKSDTGRVPITRFWIVPPVNPVNDPVPSLGVVAGTNVFAPAVLVKVTVVAVTVALPTTSIDPVTLVAMAGITKAAVLKATKLKRE